MRSVLQWLLAFFTLGMIAPGCGTKPDTPVAATDVTLIVPAMN